jgi:hypothetical protein
VTGLGVVVVVCVCVQLSSVLLRQNPHNVHEWHKRAKLYKDRDNLPKVGTDLGTTHLVIYATHYVGSPLRVILPTSPCSIMPGSRP